MIKNQSFSWDYYSSDPETKQSPITRIELYEKDGGFVAVYKYKKGWTASSDPFESYWTNEHSFDEIVAWLKDNGWTYRVWFSIVHGKRCRAFLGKPMPVHGRNSILKLRSKVSNGQLVIPDANDDLSIWYDYVSNRDKIKFLPA